MFSGAVPGRTPAAAAVIGAGSTELLDATRFSEARRVADWIVSSKDSGDLPYMVIDKVNARLFLFNGEGRVRATTPILLGLARGDDSPPGIGTRALSALTPAERITPAGRFVVGAGKDIGGADVIWIDYDAAIALHRASDRKPGMGARSRSERLSSATPTEKRVSLGCVNVSTAFYDRFIQPTFGVSRGVAYILPETRSATVEFNMPKHGDAG